MANDLSGAEAYAAVGKERSCWVRICRRQTGRSRGVWVSGVGGILGALFGGIPFGEIDGAITPRLKRLVAIFRQPDWMRSFHRVADYLATHAGW